MDKLTIGCGDKIEEGYINLDKIALKGVDVVHDLDVFPYPFEGETFIEIKAIDVLEHVDDIAKVMEELWRIMKEGGLLYIRGPHACYPEQLWRDPTHKRGFVPESFDCWDTSTHYGKTCGWYSKARFKILRREEINKGMEYTLKKVYEQSFRK